MIIKTCWIGGRYPATQPEPMKLAPIPTGELKVRLATAIAMTPGITRREMTVIFPSTNEKTIASALNRLQYAGEVYSRRCLDSIEGAPGKYWFHRWYLTKKG